MILLRESMRSAEDHVQVQNDAVAEEIRSLFCWSSTSVLSGPHNVTLSGRGLGWRFFVPPTRQRSSRIPISEQKRALGFESSTTMNATSDLHSWLAANQSDISGETTMPIRQHRVSTQHVEKLSRPITQRGGWTVDMRM